MSKAHVEDENQNPLVFTECFAFPAMSPPVHYPTRMAIGHVGSDRILEPEDYVGDYELLKAFRWASKPCPLDKDCMAGENSWDPSEAYGDPRLGDVFKLIRPLASSAQLFSQLTHCWITWDDKVPQFSMLCRMVMCLTQLCLGQASRGRRRSSVI